MSGTSERLALLGERTLQAASPSGVVSLRYGRRRPGFVHALAVLRGTIPPFPAALRRPLTLTANLVVASVALVVLTALGAAVLSRLLGYSSVIVYGGSMADSLPVGSIAVTEEVRAEAVGVGDVILFHPPNTSPQPRPVMHRVVSVREEDGQRLFRTKGDANATPDPWEVGLEGRGARLVYSVPYVGYLVNFARTPLGWVLLLVLPATYMAFSTLRRIWARESTAR